MNLEQSKKPKKTFGTFAGVFTPTTLTILGVIMYIRYSWVVGNAGVGGAIGIVLLAVAITFTTALSLSSITTNVRIGSGGAFSLISQSLGVEIGGAIGIPFYFAQAIAVAMYVFGFREGLQMLLPEFNPLILDAAVFSVIMGIAFISTSFAFKIQYIILGIIVFSLVSIFGSLFIHDLNYDFQWIGDFAGSDDGTGGDSFWIVFAVFFPAVTGVMAGANMSGDLTNPRKSIPYGTLTSVVLTTIIYISLAFVAALIASPEELVNNYNIFIEKSLYPPIVLAGLLGATLSSALGSFVGAPRILLALGEKNILPKSKFIAKRSSRRGEPVHAMLITTVIVIIGLSLRNLNTIAPLITMFFMITYAMVNVIVLIEQSLNLPSFRPTLRLSMIIPALGALGSIAMMFILNVMVAIFSLVFIIVFYLYLMSLRLKSEAGDSRSGLFTALAEWATKKSNELRKEKEVRSWRPDLLVPVIRAKDLRSSFKLIYSIIKPQGSAKILLLKNTDEKEQRYLQSFVIKSVRKFSELKLSASYTMVDNEGFNPTVNASMQSLNAAFFKPNTIFVSLDSSDYVPENINKLYQDTRKNDYGMLLYIPYSTASLAIEKSIHLWLKNIPSDWKESFDIGNNNLSILTSILMSQNWKGTLNVHVVCEEENCFTSDDIKRLNYMVRFPKNTNLDVRQGDLKEHVARGRSADINIFTTFEDMKIEDMVELVNSSRISGLFCLDSSQINALV
ncbi:amino acid permease [Psychroflexus sediminis]|uniref:Transporter, cation-chloride cotransporter (CCC) family n=1 Tax=Psychroflexus sediminis TaxID=470826 RepID=A0A1G7WEJ0_9FLAO|nr:amino acid permease [Psychroflexus sediminis]SDG70417.1 transporter, cation-chloride cotransporter (CCC) family [Psychroflexus sediminis]